MLIRQVFHNSFKHSKLVNSLLSAAKSNNHESLRSVSSFQGVPRTDPKTAAFSYLTMGQLLENSVEKTPDRIAISSAHQDIDKTYTQFNEDVDRLALAMHRIGIDHLDNVGIWAVNQYEWVVTQFATAKLGAVLITINPGYKERELIACLNLVELKMLICNQSFKSSNYIKILQNSTPSIFQNANGHRVKSKEVPTLQHLVFLDQADEIAPPNFMRYSEFLRLADDKNGPTFEAKADFDDVVNVQFTSGTTGLPKGAMLTHFNIIQNVNFITPRLFENYIDNGDQNARVCLPNPLYHCFGTVVGASAIFHVNGTIVLPGPVSNPSESIKAIGKYGFNFFYGTPTMWADFLEHSKGRESEIKTLKRGVMSGAPCPPTLLKKLMSELDHLDNILIPYGSTELSPVITLTSIRDAMEKQIETVGKPIDYVEVKIVDPKTGKVLKQGEHGEVCARGHCVFPGYYNQPDKTKEVVDSTYWYHTGDIGYFDSEGYLRICGRIKEMVIRGGENIYPKEIEDFIFLHPSIEDVHIVGIPDERFGEELAAYIKMKPNTEPLTSDDIKAFLKDKISHFKIPRHVRFVDDFPKTITGKVRKVELKQIAAKELCGL